MSVCLASRWRGEQGLLSSTGNPPGGGLALEGGAGGAGRGSHVPAGCAKCRSSMPGVLPCVCLFGLADVKHTHTDSQPRGLCAEFAFNPPVKQETEQCGGKKRSQIERIRSGSRVHSFTYAFMHAFIRRQINDKYYGRHCTEAAVEIKYSPPHKPEDWVGEQKHRHRGHFSTK